MTHKLLAVLLALALCLTLLSGCGQTAAPSGTSESSQAAEDSGSSDGVGSESESVADYDPLHQFSEPQAGDPIATIQTSLGDVVVRLFPDIAPLACENFTTLSENGSYDGMTFHRVIEGFMIQSGDYNGEGGQSIYGGYFDNEPSDEMWNIRGALCMANADINMNKSQWYIVQATPDDMSADSVDSLNDEKYPAEVKDKYLSDGGAPWLDGKYTVFGQVLEGMDVVDAIAAVETTGDIPDEDVLVNHIEISEYAG